MSILASKISLLRTNICSMEDGETTLIGHHWRSSCLADCSLPLHVRFSAEERVRSRLRTFHRASPFNSSLMIIVNICVNKLLKTSGGTLFSRPLSVRGTSHVAQHRCEGRHYLHLAKAFWPNRQPSPSTTYWRIVKRLAAVSTYLCEALTRNQTHVLCALSLLSTSSPTTGSEPRRRTYLA